MMCLKLATRANTLFHFRESDEKIDVTNQLQQSIPLLNLTIALNIGN